VLSYLFISIKFDLAFFLSLYNALFFVIYFFVVKCDTERDLGIIMSADLKVGSQCNQACLKANRMLDLITRSFITKSPDVLLNLYKTIVCPHLEYSVSAWSPHYQKDKQTM